jgi:hypothetical protein
MIFRRIRGRLVSFLDWMLAHTSNPVKGKLILKTWRKIFLSVCLGSLICVGHCLARAAHVFTFHDDCRDYKSAELGTGTQTPGQPCSELPLSGDKTSDTKKWEGFWNFWKLSEPPDGSEGFLHALLLGALLISIVCAFILNSYFPDEYRMLGKGELHTALVQSIIPTLQVLAVAVACATIEHFPVHSIATGIYLCLFIVWDLAILVVKPPPEGKRFWRKVGGYFIRIDLPAAAPFMVMFFIANRAGGASAELILTGVLCAQALAAVIAVAAVMWEDYTDKRDKLSPPEPPKEPPATAAPTEPPAPAPTAAPS